MKRIAFLKTLVTIAFVLCMIAVFFGLPFILMVAVAPNRVPEPLVQKESPAFYYAVFYVGHLAFTYALFQLKKTLEFFYKKIYFDDRVIQSLALAGKGFIGSAVLLTVLEFVYHLIAEARFEVGIEFSYNSIFFALVLGLFFLVLSDVFTNAKNLKEENDLTV